jgi:type IV pilus assembly protein PilA
MLPALKRFWTSQNGKKGFTLLEVLLVVAAISILASIVIVAINPTKQLGDTRDGQRKNDVTTILNAVYQYSLDNNGSIPPTILNMGCTSAATPAKICKTGAASCTSGTDLSVLTTNEKYLLSIPVDPSVSDPTYTGYYVTKDANNRVTVCAPSAEQTASVSAGL